MSNSLTKLLTNIEARGYDLHAPTRWSRRLIRSLGFELKRYGPLTVSWCIREALTSYDIKTLLDVGGNRGQFGLAMRDLGFRGTIHSFEPVPEARDVLEAVAKRDGNWVVHAQALGAFAGTAQFNIGRLDQTSSLKSVEPVEAEANNVLEVVRQIDVEINTLDAFAAGHGIRPESTFLKIDVQGAELEVLAGGAEFLSHVPMVLTETALTSAYKDGSRLEDIINIFKRDDLHVAAIQPIYASVKRNLLVDMDVLAMRPRILTRQ